MVHLKWATESRSKRNHWKVYIPIFADLPVFLLLLGYKQKEMAIYFNNRKIQKMNKNSRKICVLQHVPNVRPIPRAGAFAICVLTI